MKKSLNNIFSYHAGYSHLEMILIILFLGISFPALIQLYSVAVIQISEAQVSEQAVVLCEQKMELIIADKISKVRGYTWITTPNRYPPENLGNGFLRTTQISLTNLNNIPCAEVTITIQHEYIEPVSIKCILTKH